MKKYHTHYAHAVTATVIATHPGDQAARAALVIKHSALKHIDVVLDHWCFLLKTPCFLPLRQKT